MVRRLSLSHATIVVVLQHSEQDELTLVHELIHYFSSSQRVVDQLFKNSVRFTFGDLMNCEAIIEFSERLSHSVPFYSDRCSAELLANIYSSIYSLFKFYNYA